MEQESGNFQEKRDQLIVERISKFFVELGVTDIGSSVEGDGVHFSVALPQEHIATRKKQAASLAGYLDPTQFDRAVVIPFRKRFETEYGEYLTCKFLPKNIASETMEFVISDKKFSDRF